MQERLQILLKQYEAMQQERSKTFAAALQGQNYEFAAKIKLVMQHNEIFISELKNLLK